MKPIVVGILLLMFLAGTHWIAYCVGRIDQINSQIRRHSEPRASRTKGG